MAGDSPVDRLELVRKADIALYRAKDAGRNDYRLFSPDMDANVKLRGSIEEELRDALATGKGLTIHYQPQVGSAGEIVGLEALLRWDHPMRGLIAPEQFVPIAEETGLIVPLGEWVFRQACIVSRRWPGLFMAINLSPIQFRSSGFFESLMRIVRTTGAKPASIQLEVTERVLLDDDDSAKAVLARLREEGFAIVLDDFGTGYSSLAYIRDFPFDRLKIDRSFVHGLKNSERALAIIEAVANFGRILGKDVVAEGIETEQEMQAMQKVGCTHLQGYLFAKALPAEKIEAMVALGRLAAIRNSEPVLDAGSSVAKRVITGRRGTGGKAA
jgi:EAL domain-containing protein (putative c-di-GMP-specific phosphodiesterase class I)